ncbi:MAG TPA: S8 family serine peptidase [Arenimonas sp.]|nr:S8 family serine peptidase [Arenimonas sp.]
MSTASGSQSVTTSGVAPRAHLISYKACEDEAQCRGAWTLASVEQAVADGVDVINYSISSGSSGPWNDTIGNAMLAAREAGIVVAASAGNDGPDAGTLYSVASAPWVLSVAASTHDRQIANRVFLSGGNSPLPGGGTLNGSGRTAGTNGLPMVMVRPNPLLCAEGADTDSTTGGNKPASWTASTYSGLMVLCDRGIYPRVAKSFNAGAAGASSMLLLNQASEGNSIVADQHSIPSSHLTYSDSQALLAWLATGSGHQARLEGERWISNPDMADQQASFSSRGPGLVADIGKPDITAPGVSILAATASGNSLFYSSGTSMSSPHMAGAAALLLSAFPSWTPDQILSAIIGTAADGVVREDGVTPSDPHDTGAGRAALADAARAGLYFPSTPAAGGFQTFRAANPGMGGDPSKINYPSVSFGNCETSCSARREVRDMVGGGSWQVEVVEPDHVTISVSPSEFTLTDGANQVLQITATPQSTAQRFNWTHGQIRLRRVTADGRADTVIPLSVRPAPANRAPVPVLDYFHTTPGAPLTVAAPGMLGNDFDPDGQTASFTRYSFPANGTLSDVSADGSFTYTPNAQFSGDDSFQYEICDGAECSWGTATIRVQSAAQEYSLWYFTRAANTDQQGFVRLINLGAQSGAVQVWGIDDAGNRSSGTLSLTLSPHQSMQFNSQDLENGNPSKGLTGSIGSGSGDWRLVVSTPLQLVVQGLLRTPDGFLTTVHSVSPEISGNTVVPIFNPASNPNQVSWLRLVNPGSQTASVQITGRDDAGQAGSGTVSLSLAAGAAIELSSTDLEVGNAGKGLSGALGGGEGKWRLAISSTQAIKALSLLRDPGGYLTNLSTLADQSGNAGGVLTLPYVPSGSNTEQQGFVRTVNRTATTQSVSVTAIDDGGQSGSGSISYAMPALAAQQFNSQDLEQGNASKGLTGSVAPGSGDWRLQFSVGGDADAQSLIRTPDGFLTTVHDVSATLGDVLLVPVFNPASNPNQVSWLRLVNPNNVAVDVTMTAFDDAGGGAPGGEVMLSLSANSSLELSATDLESGNSSKGLVGAFGSGTGKWRLHVWSSASIKALSLLRDPEGYLTNLSSVGEQ